MRANFSGKFFSLSLSHTNSTSVATADTRGKIERERQKHLNSFRLISRSTTSGNRNWNWNWNQEQAHLSAFAAATLLNCFKVCNQSAKSAARRQLQQVWVVSLFCFLLLCFVIKPKPVNEQLSKCNDRYMNERKVSWLLGGQRGDLCVDHCATRDRVWQHLFAYLVFLLHRQTFKQIPVPVKWATCWREELAHKQCLELSKVVLALSVSHAEWHADQQAAETTTGGGQRLLFVSSSSTWWWWRLVSCWPSFGHFERLIGPKT